MGEAKRRGKRIFPSKRVKQVVLRVAVIAVCILAVVDFVARRNVSPVQNTDPHRTFGSAGAEIQIVQFIDFQNPECARGAKILQSFMKRHPKQFLLSTRYFHSPDRNSLRSCIFAECAARQGLFWPYYEDLFVKQNQWRRLLHVDPYLTTLARDVFADMDMFGSCVGDIEVKQIVEEDTRLGQSHGITTVPTYYVNKKKIVGVDDLEKYLLEYFENKRLGLL